MTLLTCDTTILGLAVVDGSGLWGVGLRSNWTADDSTTNSAFLAGDSAQFNVGTLNGVSTVSEGLPWEFALRIEVVAEIRTSR